MAKYLDNDGLLYLWQKIKTKFATITDLDGKVDKETGKGLSTNDYTTAEKNKLNGIGGGAEANPRVSIDGGNNRKILGYAVYNNRGALVMAYDDGSLDGGEIVVPLASAV